MTRCSRCQRLVDGPLDGPCIGIHTHDVAEATPPAPPAPVEALRIEVGNLLVVTGPGEPLRPEIRRRVLKALRAVWNGATPPAPPAPVCEGCDYTEEGRIVSPHCPKHGTPPTVVTPEQAASTLAAMSLVQPFGDDKVALEMGAAALRQSPAPPAPVEADKCTFDGYDGVRCPMCGWEAPPVPPPARTRKASGHADLVKRLNERADNLHEMLRGDDAAIMSEAAEALAALRSSPDAPAPVARYTVQTNARREDGLPPVETHAPCLYTQVKTCVELYPGQPDMHCGFCAGHAHAVPVTPRVCGVPTPDRSGRACDKPHGHDGGHDGEHWTFGGAGLTWPAPSAPVDKEIPCDDYTAGSASASTAGSASAATGHSAPSAGPTTCPSETPAPPAPKFCGKRVSDWSCNLRAGHKGICSYMPAREAGDSPVTPPAPPAPVEAALRYAIGLMRGIDVEVPTNAVMRQYIEALTALRSSPDAQTPGWHGTVKSLAYEIGTVMDVARRRSDPDHDTRQMIARLEMWRSRLLSLIPAPESPR